MRAIPRISRQRNQWCKDIRLTVGRAGSSIVRALPDMGRADSPRDTPVGPARQRNRPCLAFKVEWNVLDFSISVRTSANGRQAMWPTKVGRSFDDGPVTLTRPAIKEIRYAFLEVAAGAYRAIHTP
jgi:hypothetical protein